MAIRLFLAEDIYNLDFVPESNINFSVNQDEHELFFAAGEQSINLDIQGEVFGDASPYEGSYVVIPKAYQDQVLETQGLVMLNDVTVTRVPYWQTGNTSGDTVYIASEV